MCVWCIMSVGPRNIPRGSGDPRILALGALTRANRAAGKAGQAAHAQESPIWSTYGPRPRGFVNFYFARGDSGVFPGAVTV